MAVLLMNVCHAVAAELAREAPPASGAGELALVVVNDQELDAIYGKGYHVPLFRPEVVLPVILWDEGKRKERIQGISANVVSGGHRDINQQAVRAR